MPLDLPDLFVGEYHPLTRTAAILVERHYRPELFPATPVPAPEWRYRLGMVLADDLQQQGLQREAYTLRLHATGIESWTAALYNAWVLSLKAAEKTR